MDIKGLQTVLFGANDLAEAARFWADFGLEKISVNDTELVFSTPEQSRVLVRPLASPSLPAAPVPGPTVRQVTWAVADPKTLDDVARELEKESSTRRDQEGRVLAVDPAGHAIAFELSRLQPVTLEATPFNMPGNTQRMNERGRVYTSAQPVHMAHVVYAVQNLRETAEYYERRLGFRVTDSYRDGGVFLRAAGADDHHHLFLLKHGDAVGFHHLAFDVRDIHELFGGGLHMTAQGWKTHIGPGRHPLSSAYFWYFKNPCGGAAEYDFDSDVVDERWEPREYERTPANFAEWAFADGATRFEGVQTSRVDS